MNTEDQPDQNNMWAAEDRLLDEWSGDILADDRRIPLVRQFAVNPEESAYDWTGTMMMYMKPSRYGDEDMSQRAKNMTELVRYFHTNVPSWLTGEGHKMPLKVARTLTRAVLETEE
jgi:hypothetical protein